MKIECPHCGQEYDLATNLIGQRVQCTSCSNEFVVENPKLMPCPDCLAKVSKRASVCPHCGALLGGNATRENVASKDDNAPENDILVCHPAAISFTFEIIIGTILTPILIGVIYLIWVAIELNCTSYRITSRRVLVRRGWFNKTQTEIWIKDMRAVNMQQSFVERLFGIGSISIGTAATSGNEINMHGLRDTQKIVDLINDLRKQ